MRLMPMIDFLKSIYDDNPVVGVEIGVFRGEGSEKILTTLNISRLYLIDPYGDPDFVSPLTPEIPAAWDEAHDRLREFGDKIIWIRRTSNDAVDSIIYGLDFVYIDGNHDYEFVKRDILNYGRLVKSGGYIGGHDYVENYYGAKDAVDEFVKFAGCGLIVEDKGSGFPDWWIPKSSLKYPVLGRY